MDRSFNIFVRVNFAEIVPKRYNLIYLHVVIRDV